MTFAERVAAIRKELKFSQERFGELVNVSQRSVAFWESGERMPSHATISALADRLGVSVDYLLGRSEDKEGTNKKQPAANDSELLENVFQEISALPLPYLMQVRGYLDGLKAQKGTGAAPSTDPVEDPTSAP